MEELNELALFAGAGGGILGGHLLGWRTVCAVEYNLYCAKVLMQRQNDRLLPRFHRGGHGVADWMEQSVAISNGQVPAVAAAAWSLLYQRMYEKINKC